MQNEVSNSILVLDSGIGGMTIVEAIRKLDRSISITYISDSACFPYGSMDTDTLKNRVYFLVSQALKIFKFDAVVIACNTASTIVLDVLRAAFSIPFIGVVPPIKTASKVSRSGIIGLLATEKTVQREYIDTLIQNFASESKIVRIGCSGLATLAEEKVRNRPVDREKLRSTLAPQLDEMDVVIMGCTHYPILLDELVSEFGSSIQWLDPAFPVASRLLQVLENNNNNVTERQNINIVYFTGRHKLPQDMWPFLNQMGFSHLEYWPPSQDMTMCKLSNSNA